MLEKKLPFEEHIGMTGARHGWVRRRGVRECAGGGGAAVGGRKWRRRESTEPYLALERPF
jgi:hypothetical protein